jgi:hypothetical protein
MGCASRYDLKNVGVHKTRAPNLAPKLYAHGVVITDRSIGYKETTRLHQEFKIAVLIGRTKPILDLASPFER